MKLSLDEMISRITIGDKVRFKCVDELMENPDFGQDNYYKDYSTHTGEQDRSLEDWIHRPTKTFVYAHPNYTVSPNEEFVILGCRIYEYKLEEPNESKINFFKRSDPLKSRIVRGCQFELGKADNPNFKLFGVIHEVLNFEIRYGNVRSTFEVK